MRILALETDAFGGHGGISNFNQDFLRALCAYPGCTEVIAVPRFVPNPIGTIPTKLTYVTAGLNSRVKYFKAVIKSILNEPEVDMIVCAHINLLPVAYLAHLWVKAPILLLIYGIDAWQPTGSRMTNYLVKKVEGFASISDVTRQRFIKWAHRADDKGFLLPNAIELDNYSPGPKSVQLLDRYELADKVVLMTLGRLVSAERSKGFDEVLEILPSLSRKLTNVAYLIAGEGPDRDRLEKKAESLGVRERVVFTGLVPETEKADHYRLADAYVMPSRGEGFGFVFLEAMACGVPVVASEVDGSREAVRNGEMGILVNPDDLDEVEAGVLEALTDIERLVPSELHYFSYGNFEKRCHKIIATMLDEHKVRMQP